MPTPSRELTVTGLALEAESPPPAPAPPTPSSSAPTESLAGPHATPVASLQPQPAFAGEPFPSTAGHRGVKQTPLYHAVNKLLGQPASSPAIPSSAGHPGTSIGGTPLSVGFTPSVAGTAEANRKVPTSEPMKPRNLRLLETPAQQIWEPAPCAFARGGTITPGTVPVPPPAPAAAPTSGFAMPKPKSKRGRSPNRSIQKSGLRSASASGYKRKTSPTGSASTVEAKRRCRANSDENVMLGKMKKNRARRAECYSTASRINRRKRLTNTVIGKMKCKELKQELRQYGAPVGGKKKELAARLQSVRDNTPDLKRMAPSHYTDVVSCVARRGGLRSVGASPYPNAPRSRASYTPRMEQQAKAASERKKLEGQIKVGTPVVVSAKHFRYAGSSGRVLSRRKKTREGESEILTVELETGEKVLIGETLLETAIKGVEGKLPSPEGKTDSPPTLSILSSARGTKRKVKRKALSSARMPRAPANTPYNGNYLMTPHHLVTPGPQLPSANGTPQNAPGMSAPPATPSATYNNSYFLGEAMKQIQILQLGNRLTKMPSLSAIQGLVDQIGEHYPSKKKELGYTPRVMWANSDRWFIKQLQTQGYVPEDVEEEEGSDEMQEDPDPVVSIGQGRQIVWGFDDRGAYIKRMKTDLLGLRNNYRLVSVNDVACDNMERGIVKRIFKTNGGSGRTTKLCFLPP